MNSNRSQDSITLPRAALSPVAPCQAVRSPEERFLVARSLEEHRGAVCCRVELFLAGRFPEARFLAAPSLEAPCRAKHWQVGHYNASANSHTT